MVLWLPSGAGTMSPADMLSDLSDLAQTFRYTVRALMLDLYAPCFHVLFI